MSEKLNVLVRPMIKPKRPEVRLPNGAVYPLTFDIIKEYKDRAEPFTISKWLQELKAYENKCRIVENQGKIDGKQHQGSPRPVVTRPAVENEINEYKLTLKEQSDGVITRVKNFMGMGKKEKKK